MIDFAHFRRGRYLIAVSAVAGALLAGGLPASAATAPALSPMAPLSDTRCADGVCIHVDGGGLQVNSATVKNVSAPMGRGKIINVDDGAVHTGPILNPGQTWTFAFSRSVKNGDEICGEVGSAGEPCVPITS